MVVLVVYQFGFRTRRGTASTYIFVFVSAIPRISFLDVNPLKTSSDVHKQLTCYCCPSHDAGRVSQPLVLAALSPVYTQGLMMVLFAKPGRNTIFVRILTVLVQVQRRRVGD